MKCTHTGTTVLMKLILRRGHLAFYILDIRSAVLLHIGYWKRSSIITGPYPLRIRDGMHSSILN